MQVVETKESNEFMEVVNFNFVQVVSIVVLILVGIVVVRFAISFDVNAWLQERSNRRRDSLKLLCPHTEIWVNERNELIVKSYFQSPSGTLDWICSKCQLRTHSQELPDEIANYYAQNPKIYSKKLNQFEKRIKKIYDL